jgi:hypothetical protein
MPEPLASSLPDQDTKTPLPTVTAGRAAMLLVSARVEGVEPLRSVCAAALRIDLVGGNDLLTVKGDQGDVADLGPSATRL